MAERIVIEASVVRTRIEALKVAYPELEHDAELLAATVEGETDFDAVLAKIMDEFFDAVTLGDAIGERISDLRERSARIARKSEAMKGLAMSLMETAGQSSIVLPVATLSVRSGFESVDVTDAEQLPQGYYTRTPDKKAIRTALNKGEFIPGARIVTGPQTLAIRTK